MATAERSDTSATLAPLVVDLAELRSGDLSRAGGKAANLGELIAAGLPVPPGFCVTTDAYAQATAGLDPSRPAGELRAVVADAAVPPPVAAAVGAAYRALGGGPVAVRSSATAEDLPTASFAGQQDTFLNVVGEAAVLDAVRRCWASLWTDRAVAYRAEAGIDAAAVRTAVVVQVMVDARVAGVLFTADPLSGRRTRTVVDASPGLGEAVVSGAVNPDHFSVEDGIVVERRLGDKALAVRPRAGGGVERVPLPGGGASCLTDDELRALVALGHRAEDHFGTPQDVEWALAADGTAWLTQARPITTLYPAPPARTGAAARGRRVWFNATLAQGLTRPFTPMGVAAARVMAGAPAALVGLPVADPVAGPPAVADLGGRVFVDVTAVLRSPLGRRAAVDGLAQMEPRSGTVIRALLADAALAPGPLWPTLRRVVPAALRLRIPLLVAQAALAPASARRRVARLAAGVPGVAPLPADATGAQRLDRAVTVLQGAFPPAIRTAPVFATGMALRALARRLAGPDLGDAAADDVLRALPHNVTTQMDLALWALAASVRDDPAAAAATTAPDAAARFHAGTLPPALQDGLAAFLRRYGHRAVAEIDVGMPRWSDDPAHLLGAVANYLRLDPADPAQAPDARFAAAARAADAEVVRVTARVARRSRLRGLAVGVLLRRVRALAGMRESHKDVLVRGIAAARAELAAVGTELADRGLLDTGDDVWFLDLATARSALAGTDHRALVGERRATYARELRRRHLPRVLLDDGTEPEALADPTVAQDGALTGTPASAGTVTGPARVVLDPVGAHLEPGEILVAPSTDPGWTPLFLTAGALVMEMGGANSHGAVVAREYGIPAVVGVPGATTRLATGTTLTVDGAAGTVRTAGTGNDGTKEGNPA